jgi:competence protein ComEC
MKGIKKRNVLWVFCIIAATILISYLENNLSPSNETSLPLFSKQTETMEVHFIDVGQGDSIYIKADGHSMLIDAGEKSEGTTVIHYLEALGVDNLDYIICTHPHSDHIGGMNSVLDSLSVNQIIMSEVNHTTDTYEDLLQAIGDHNLTITKAVPGNQYALGPASFTILSPVSDFYEDVNNYSVGIKLSYYNNSFILTGDAEALAEKEMLNEDMDLTGDVLKLGHHGSSYSSCSEFLDAVSPSYAVISVGKDNTYGHPHHETIEALVERGIPIYRTDEQGTIIFQCDGDTVSVHNEN